MLLITTLFAGSARGQSEVNPALLLEFYSHADSVSKFAPSEDTLRVIKTKVIDGNYVTFIGYKGSPQVRIAAVTKTPIKNVNKDIALTVQFRGISPLPGTVTTWGYIYDRNLDGKVDYMALLGGAAPFEKGEMPDDYPPRKVELTMEQKEFLVNHCQLVFNHWADDNYDGKLDGLIHIDMDPVRDWVMDQIVVMSSNYDGKLDTVWAFQNKLDNRSEGVAHKKNRIPYRPIDKDSDEITPETFAQTTHWLTVINRAAKAAGLKSGDFLTGKEEWY